MTILTTQDDSVYLTSLKTTKIILNQPNIKG
jgi:hypothetical protein